jgi:hypothetical protein
MPDLSRVKPSVNFEDRTDDTPAQKFLTSLTTLLNPVTAVRKTGATIHAELIKKGVIADPVGDDLLARIDEQIRKRHAQERANPPAGFTINEQGIYIPNDNNAGLSPKEKGAIIDWLRKKKWTKK